MNADKNKESAALASGLKSAFQFKLGE